MRYIIKSRPRYRIAQFYKNVIRKYRHTYSVELMHANIDEAVNAMYQIEQSLLRRRPTLPRWQHEGWYMANAGKWYYAYTVTEDAVVIEDACHSQNMR